MNNKDKIQHPFQAPEGYFGSFEERLKQKLSDRKEPKLTVQRNRRRLLLWAAAASQALAVAGVWLLTKPDSKGLPPVIVKHDSTKNGEFLLVNAADSLPQEDRLAGALLEEAAVTAVPAVIDAPAADDPAIEAELDAAGLIVAGLDDGIFEDLNIMP